MNGIGLYSRTYFSFALPSLVIFFFTFFFYFVDVSFCSGVDRFEEDLVKNAAKTNGVDKGSCKMEQ